MSFFGWLSNLFTGGGSFADAARQQGATPEAVRQTLQTPFTEPTTSSTAIQTIGHDVTSALAPVTQPLVNSVSDVLSGLRWTYNHAISQPLSTAFLISARMGGKDPSTQLRLFSPTEWGKAWTAAEHISPGQAMLFPFEAYADKGLYPDVAAAQVENAPLTYAKPAPAMLPPNFNTLPYEQQQQQLKQLGMPAIGNQKIEQMRQDSTIFKYTSGAVDLASNVFLDPTILAGKGLSALKEAKITRAAPAAGWSGNDIQTLVNSSQMVKARDWLWDHRDNPAMVNNLSLVQKSAIGPRFGGILATLKNPNEVTDFLKVGMGDADARVRLETANAQAALAIQQDTGRLSALDLMRTKVQNFPNLQRLVDQKIDTLNAQLNANTDLVQRYNRVLDHFGEIDSINLTNWSTRMAELRTAGQAAYQTGRGYSTSPAAAVGLMKTRLDNGFFSPAVTVLRSFRNYRPNGILPLDDITSDGVNEVRGQLARIPNIGPAERQQLLNTYLNTQSDAERLRFAREMDAFATEQVGAQYGLTRAQANDLYSEHLRRQGAEIAKIRDALSAAQKPGPDGQMIPVHAFDTDGNGLTLEPNLATKLANDHVLIDLDRMDKVLRAHGSAIQSVIAGSKASEALADEGVTFGTAYRTAADWVTNSADFLGEMWKFGTLFRLGYVPRVAGDDLAGQVARLGAASMAVRAFRGASNAAMNLATRAAGPALDARQLLHEQGIKYAQQQLDALEPQISRWQGRVDARVQNAANARTAAERALQRAQDRVNNLSPNARQATRNAANTLLLQRERELRQAERLHFKLTTTLTPQQVRLNDMLLQQGHLQRGIADAQQSLADIEKARQKVIQGNQPVDVGNGLHLPPALDPYYYKLTSSEQDIQNIFYRNKALIHGNLVRAFGVGGMRINAFEDEAGHADAWARAINTQIAQDQLGRQAVSLIGQVPDDEAIQELTRWLKTAEGTAYRKRLALGRTTDEDIAASAWYEAKHYVPTEDIRNQALTPEGVDAPFLKRAIPQIARPEVHTNLLDQSFAGNNRYRRAVDDIKDHWFKTMAALPADRLSRHPLFNQLYEGHGRRLVAQETAQRAELSGGKWTMSQEDADALADHARRLALRDMRGLVFDVAHRSDAAHALRLISPFFAATTEGWQRWARILGDKPQVVGYAGKFFNTPLALGQTVDQDGNIVDQYGYTVDPATGKRTLVPKGNRYIRVRVPKWVAGGPIGAALGMDPSGNWQVSQDSMDLVLQGDPWFNPGTGPIVQIPVDSFVSDKPQLADLAQKTGILPFGPQGGSLLQEAYQYLAPRTVKDALTAFNTSDERYQQVKLQIMQQNWYEHQELGKPLLTPRQVADRVRNYWLWSTASSALEPAATKRADPYQFFRDQYNILRRRNPLTADQEYLSRFGDSHFLFAQAMTKNGAGIPATQKAAQLARQYGDIIAAEPDLAALIVGPEGNGPFSPGAYRYELTTPLVPGGAEMMRTKMSADQAMQENQRRHGWDQFMTFMNGLNAQLVNRGLKTLNDRGAEDLKVQKQAFMLALGSPTLPDGSPNPVYNEQWSKDYYTVDQLKYERLVPKLEQVAFSPLANNPARTDLRTLQQYLGLRRAVVAELAKIKKAGGDGTLTAQSNSGLSNAFAQIVQQLVLSDTSFGDLYHRYLDRDMGINLATEGSPTP